MRIEYVTWQASESSPCWRTCTILHHTSPEALKMYPGAPAALLGDTDALVIGGRVGRAQAPCAEPGRVVELVEHEPRVWEIRSLVPGWVKLMTYQIDTCRFLAWWSALIGYGKDWLAQCQDNVIEWDIRSWCWLPISQWGSTIKSSCVCIVMNLFSSWYDLRCWQEIKLQLTY